ncbi:MAG: PocR ligand-binding domain-containing protein [Sedimentibacter sp.]|uniref:PocR ligand-binding domain-containing protein n=1 Tax=Sedimentibacter sp. TaxID=1960295 RepID=UPI0031593DCC
MIKVKQDGSIDMSVLEISDIVDISLLQKFQDNFAIGMNCASVTVDRDGNPITKPSSYTRFCEGYVHGSSIGDSRCANSHNRMGQKAASSGRPFVGPCHAGLIDFAAPVIINNELLGTVLGGQILSDTPKEELYRKIAQEIGVDEAGLVNAVNQITVTDMDNINAAAEVLFIVVNTLVENGYARIKLEVVAKKLSSKFMDIASAFQELAASAQIISQQQQALNNEITQVGKVTEEINDVLKFISQIAMNTKLLGFNASIEAAHAGTAGRGFAVVADEIKILSDKSKETADNILELTAQIKKSVNSTTDHSHETLQTTEQQTAAMEEVSSAVQEIVSLADELNNMMKSVN